MSIFFRTAHSEQRTQEHTRLFILEANLCEISRLRSLSTALTCPKFFPRNRESRFLRQRSALQKDFADMNIDMQTARAVVAEMDEDGDGKLSFAGGYARTRGSPNGLSFSRTSGKVSLHNFFCTNGKCTKTKILGFALFCTIFKKWQPKLYLSFFSMCYSCRVQEGH